MPHRRSIVLATILGVVLATFAGAPASAAPPRVLHAGIVTSQDVASQAGSEPDTVVEPDVAVSPLDSRLAIAAAHDSRFADGGAVDISVAWTRDAGAHWHHYAAPGITTALGGQYDRASDPVVAFGPDGTAYLSVLLFDATTCPTAVAVLRSRNGGRTWSAPFYADRETSCRISDDKNWLVVDNGRHSAHRGRIYQFWTPFRYADETQNNYTGSPQAVRWSDDHGATWSDTSYVTPLDHATQNSQPMILPDGTIVDAFYDFGQGQHVPDVITPDSRPARHGARQARAVPLATTIDATGPIVVSTSSDGGATWSAEREITASGGGYADGVRCCLFAADIDPVTHVMYVAWEGGVADTDPVYESFSSDGTLWSSPVQVSEHDVSGIQRVNVDVSAFNGTVYVTYGTRWRPEQSGGFVRQDVSISHNGGRSFGHHIGIGPISTLKYAAQAGGYFPGDYIGTAITSKYLYIVWAVSSKPASSDAVYHQVIYGVTMRTRR